MGCGYTLARACGRYDHHAGLASVFRGRRAGYDFHRLDRIEWDLIGKDFALLVGNRLAVEAERILRVVAEPVEKAIGIGSDSRRGQRNQRTQGRRPASQGNFVEQLPVDVGVEGRVVLHHISRILDRDRVGAAGHR